MQKEIAIIPGDKLKQIVINIFTSLNVKHVDAAITADALVNANFCGVDSHGIDLLPTYVERIKHGGINKRANIKIVFENNGQMIIDADGALGPVVAHYATNQSTKLAKEHGVSWVTVKNSNHIGMLGHYTRIMCDVNLIGIVLTNSGPNVAAWGGAEAVMGNNALSVGVPGSGFPSFLLDMATGEVACGKIRLCANSGQEVPEGWILDSNGKPTTNPQDFINEGVVLPFGKHKGFGIGMMVDLLTGVISGGLFGKDVRRQRQNHTLIAGSSQTFIAYDFDKYMNKEEFNQRIDSWINMVKTSKKAFGFDEIIIPGENERNIYIQRMNEGIPITEEQMAYFDKFVDMKGVLNYE
ncbi:Ldh family oxidoreductase [Paenibacillus sp. MZ04-78.2]|uniref:Ldh family oxidoreductase n=1 Tax=Paenibacillus sp. MZ04-78.2 TaxID=2962034 RepID=UPI0020B72634|nr:Ldh family oxidoreductase [Paenibacillus sp. MZ04-78.2]MCP3776509.1 Ldh family oxidoreductase [Paenibacillus sp. MZ04-78.2]